MVYWEELNAWKPGALAGIFRGNQIVTAVGAATLRDIIGEDLPGHAEIMGQRLMGHLRGLRNALAEVRGGVLHSARRADVYL